MKKTVFAAIAAALMLTGCRSGVTVQDPAHTPALGLAEQSGVMTPPEGASPGNLINRSLKGADSLPLFLYSCLFPS